MITVPHEKQFAIVREAMKNHMGNFELDGQTCPLCGHATVVSEDKTRRYCIWEHCHALILEEFDDGK